MAENNLRIKKKKLNCSYNVDEVPVKKRIKHDSKLEWYEILSDDDIMWRITCIINNKELKKNCKADDFFLFHQKISDGDVTPVIIEELFNYR